MRVLFLADPGSVHTLRWTKGLHDKALEIHLFGLRSSDPTTQATSWGNSQTILEVDKSRLQSGIGNFSKLTYLKALPKVKRIIREFKPDLLHAHFATSYGLLGALAGFHPYVLSVWGADIFDFPKKSFLHRALVNFNLSRADQILSTSQVMARETAKYTRKPITVTPFGVDITNFAPAPAQSLFEPGDIVIGTIKALEVKYGIDYLLKAFQLLKNKYPHWPLKLLIAGDGSQKKALEQLSRELAIERDTVFTGRIPYDQSPTYHNMLSVFVALSILDSESFGVAVIEASACEKPVVVSNVGGLPEVVEEGVTGFIVPPKDQISAAGAIEKLLLDEELRLRMGRAGRARIENYYSWDTSLAQMLKIYEQLTKG